MAWLFSLCVHATDRAGRDALTAHFQGLTWRRANGVQTRCHLQPVGDRACQVLPGGLSTSGLVSEQCGREFAEAAEHLTRALETAPPFEAALIGVEVDDERDGTDIIELCRVAGEMAGFAMVVPEATWRAAGQPGGFSPFAGGRMAASYETLAARVFKAPVGSHLLVEGFEVVDRAGWYQVFAEGPGQSGNEVTLSELDSDADTDADVNACIDRVIAEYAARNTEFKWCVGPTTAPADMPERLAARGFGSWGMRGMAWDLATPAPRAAPGVAVERVGVEELERLVETMVAGWELPAAAIAKWEERYRWAFAQPGEPFRFHMALLDGVPAGAACTLLAGGLGYLLGGSVAPAARGRSVYRALIRSRLEELAAEDVRVAVTQAREATSAPMLEHLGFETVYTARVFHWVHRA